MSSTNSSQNLLVNVFRPVYRYETPTGGSTAMFTPRLDVCNIDVLTANTVTAFTAAIGDENENVYVGSNAGNDYSNLRGCSNVTALGYAAASNISNTKNSVYIGYNSGANALDSSVNVAIGPNTKGNGISNIYIGSNTGSLGTGSNNILIGHNLTGSNLSNTLLIGPTPTIYGNLSTRKVGIGRDPSYNMDISGDSRITYRLGVGMEPGKATDFNNNPLTNVPHSLDVSGYSFIRGALGINSDPADYTFNLVGNLKFDDGAGRIIMQKDPCGNSVFNFESYAAGKRAIFSINGDICASSVVAPGSTFTGDVTASNIIAVNDLSGGASHVTNIFATTVFGEDVSGYRGRFGRVDATDISGSRGTVTTLTATTFSSTNFTTANIVLPGYLRDALTPDGLDISGGNITAKSAIRANNFIGTLDNTSNRIGGVILSNTNITYAGAISNTTAAANNNIGGVQLSNGIISNSGSTTSANFFGTAANSNNIGGVTLSNGVISNSSTTNNSIGGVTLSNGNITGTFQGAIATTNAVIGGYVRNALTPSQFDISGGNISNSATSTASNFIGTSAASNSIGGVTLSNTNVTHTGRLSSGNAIVTSYIRHTVSPGSGGLDISGGNISNSATHTASNFIGTAAASNSIGGVTLSNSNAIVGGFLRNALTPSQFDISGGNISNSATSTASNFIGTATASNSIGGVTLNNGVISNGSTTSNNIGGVSLNNGAISNSGATSNNIGGIVLSGNRMVLANGTAAAPSFGFTADTTTGLYLNAVGGLDVAVSGTRFATFAGTALTMSNNNVFSGPLLSSYIRNATTPTLYDISGGRVRTAVGAVNNPAFGFLATDICAGLYLAASNQLGVAVAGTARLRIDNSSIQVGNPSSAAKTALLEVAGGYQGTGAVVSTSTFTSFPAIALQWGDAGAGSTGGFRHFIRSRHDVQLLTSTNAIDFFTNNGATAEASAGPGISNVLAMSVTSGGVGIGMSNPAVALDVSGVMRASNAASTAGVVAGFVRNAATSWTIDISGGRYRGSAGAVNNPTYAFMTDASAGLYLPAVSNIGFTIAGRERVRIDSNGSMGIGTSNPAVQFDVSGRVRIRADGSLTGYGFNNGTDTLILESTGVYGTTADLGKSATILFGNTVTNYPQARIASQMSAVTPTGFSGNLIFQTGSSTTLVERMRIHSNGNIGIATSVPNGALDISGQGATIYVGATSSTDGLIIQGYSNAAYIRPQSTGAALYLGTSNSNTVAINTSSVGINKIPSYTLDISASPGTAASININTWPRMDNTSNFLWVRGISGKTGSNVANRLRWNTTNSNTMSSNLLVWVDDALQGSYFTIRKSGIWSINYTFAASGAGYTAWLDVSTGFSNGYGNATDAGNGQMIIVNATPYNYALMSFTGYLESNATQYYRFNVNNYGQLANANLAPYLNIVFLGETPDITPNFP